MEISQKGIVLVHDICIVRLFALFVVLRADRPQRFQIVLVPGGVGEDVQSDIACNAKSIYVYTGSPVIGESALIAEMQSGFS